MARTKKTWTALLADVRAIYGETTASASAFTDAQILLVWNHAMDLRLAQMSDVAEDWLTETVAISLVANQAAYPLPAGSNSVKSVSRILVLGATTRRIPLVRNDRWIDGETTAGASTAETTYVPTWRLQGDDLRLDPAPSFSLANAIEVETEPFPSHFTAGSDALPAVYPDVLQTLLIYDTVVGLMRIEGTIGAATDAGVENHLLATRAELARAFLSVIERRQQAPVFTRPYVIG